MKKLVVYGTGMWAELVDFYFRNDSAYEVVAFTNAAAFIREDSFQGRPVVPFEEVERKFPVDEYDIFIAVGYLKMNKIRQARVAEAKAKGYTCATYISSRAMCFGNASGENCFILENNVIQPFTVIGRNVIMSSDNHIGHHGKIGDNCFISSNVVIAGACEIGRNCFLGVNSTIRDHIKLGPFVVVTPGAVVMKDCGERTVVQPAHSIYRVINRDLL